LIAISSTASKSHLQLFSVAAREEVGAHKRKIEKKYGVKVLTALAVGLDAAQVIYNSPHSPFSHFHSFSSSPIAPLFDDECIFKQP